MNLIYYLLLSDSRLSNYTSVSTFCLLLIVYWFIIIILCVFSWNDEHELMLILTSSLEKKIYADLSAELMDFGNFSGGKD